MRRGFKRDDGKLLFNARADGIVDYQEYLEITERPPIHLFLLWQHNPSLPIGSVQISDSDMGLQVDGKLVLEDPQARIALAYLKAKTIKGLPISFDTIKDFVENGCAT